MFLVALVAFRLLRRILGQHAGVHPAKLAAERAGVDPDVRVVQLRRTDKTRAEADPGGSEDAQSSAAVPSEQRHKIIYRGPYVKGPSDKPLLGGETVWALIR